MRAKSKLNFKIHGDLYPQYLIIKRHKKGEEKNNTFTNFKMNNMN